MNAMSSRLLITFTAVMLLFGAGIGVWQGFWVRSGLDAFIQDSLTRTPPPLPGDIQQYAGKRAARTIFGLPAASGVSALVIAGVAAMSRHRASGTAA